MKALTVKQPWASLIFMKNGYGAPVKMVETRSWKTKYRGKLLIHAAKKCTKDFFYGMDETELDLFVEVGLNGDKALSELDTGCVIGIVDLVDCVPIETLYGGIFDNMYERAFGDWSEGRYGWILGNPVLFDNPMSAKGKLGLWDFNPGSVNLTLEYEKFRKGRKT